MEETFQFFMVRSRRLVSRQARKVGKSLTENWFLAELAEILKLKIKHYYEACSRKVAKYAKVLKINQNLFLATLASWRENIFLFSVTNGIFGALLRPDLEGLFLAGHVPRTG